MDVVETNPYGPLKDGNGKVIPGKMVGIVCKSCETEIEDGCSFNHCFKCYNMEKGRTRKEDYCLKCNSINYGSEIRNM